MVQMPERGTFVVDDDPQDVIATALVLATSPLNAPLRHRNLAPGGDGFDVENVGWIARVGSGNDDEDEAPEDTWTLCRLPDARRVLEGRELRALAAVALALRLAFPRVVTMDCRGNFTVTDDERGTLATALLIATAPQHADLVEHALQRGGSGLRIETFGSVTPIEARERLSYPFDEDPTLAPTTQELWRLYRESDHQHGSRSAVVITGEELRGLVRQAITLRAAR